VRVWECESVRVWECESVRVREWESERVRERERERECSGSQLLSDNQTFFSSEVWYSHRTSWKRPKNWSRLVPQSGEDSASSLLFDKFVVFLQQSIIIGKIRNFEPIFMLCMIFFSLLLVLWLQFDFLDIFLGVETSRYILEWSPNANCFQKMKNSMNNRQCTEIGFFG